MGSSHPDRSRNIRIAPRYELPIPVDVDDETQRFGSGVVRDISTTGVWIEGAQPVPPVGSEIRITLMLLGASSGLRLLA